MLPHRKVGLVADGGGSARVGRHTNVLENEGTVQEDGVRAVRGERGGEHGAVEGRGQGQVGSTGERGANVDEGAGNGGGASSGQGRAQEAHVVNLVVGNLGGISLDGGGEESLLATDLQEERELRSGNAERCACSIVIVLG